MEMALAQVETRPAWTPEIPAAAIAQVIEKLADGRYPTESVRCFCGADFDDLEITTRDRYFIPHRMVLCKACALIRATPRMTPAAYYEFYNTEYRPIYDGWEFAALAEDVSTRFMKQAQSGFSFHQFLSYFEIKPTSMIEVGSNVGGFLSTFQEHGVTVHGIEIDARCRRDSREKGIPTLASIDEAIAFGLTGDVVVLKDVIEHFTDLEDMKKVKQLLAPNGVLYLFTPGLFMSQLNLLWQNAHTYTFCAESLRYVMSTLGFEEIYLDEESDSLWRVTDEPQGIEKPIAWARYAVDHLQGKAVRTLPPVRGVCKFSQSERYTAIDQNLSLGFPDIRELVQTYTGSVVIVGGGPSANTELETIRDLCRKGAKLMVIERMYPWCTAVGLHPDFVVALDGSEDVEEGFTHLQDGTIHLIGSSVHHAAVKKLVGTTTYIYGGVQPQLKVQNLWYKHGYSKVTTIMTGASVTLACLSVSLTLGFSDLHVVGFDLKVKDEEYAAGIAGKGVTRSYCHLEIGGKDITSCLSFVSFAQQFFSMMKQGATCGLLQSVQVHGDSLINDMAPGGLQNIFKEETV